jgi:hypothetical protein
MAKKQVHDTFIISQKQCIAYAIVIVTIAIVTIAYEMIYGRKFSVFSTCVRAEFINIPSLLR